jgi:hypothetical protein
LGGLNAGFLVRKYTRKATPMAITKPMMKYVESYEFIMANLLKFIIDKSIKINIMNN